MHANGCKGIGSRFLGLCLVETQDTVKQWDYFFSFLFRITYLFACVHTHVLVPCRSTCVQVSPPCGCQGLNRVSRLRHKCLVCWSISVALEDRISWTLESAWVPERAMGVSTMDQQKDKFLASLYFLASPVFSILFCCYLTKPPDDKAWYETIKHTPNLDNKDTFVP